jgi:hypothetical protein
MGTSRFAGLGLMLGGLCWLSLVPYRPPTAVSATAPDSVFSAERALRSLGAWMPGQLPRPSGSEELRLFRERLTASLVEIGLSVSLHEVRTCPDTGGDCIPITNLVAVAEGLAPGAVVFMAHYDAVPGSPGAADNGASVAVLAELARNLLAREGDRRTVMFLFTDGEEIGHLGAAGFFRDHPAVRQVVAVVNVDGSGSSGPSRVLRVAPRSGPYVRAYLARARYPLANSVRQYLFERLGSGSDFSEVLAASLPGIDFTFVGSRWHWHAPSDRLEVLDPRTVQHHGENADAALRAIASQAEAPGSDEYVYLTLPPRTVLRWPAGGVTWGLILAASLVTVAAATGTRGVRPGSLLSALAVVGALLLASAVAARLGLGAASTIAGGRPSWPDPVWPWRAVVYGLPFLTMWAGRPILVKIPSWSLMLALGAASCALAAATSAVDPRLGTPFVVASLGMSAGLVCLRFAREEWRPVGWLLVVGWVTVIFFPISHMAEVTYGFRRSVQIVWPWAIAVSTCAPLISRGGAVLSPRTGTVGDSWSMG